MPVYKVTIQRNVQEVDEFIRYIRAETPEAASAKADEIADSSDNDCPDDCASNGSFDCDSFYVDSVEENNEALTDDDEIIDA